MDLLDSTQPTTNSLSLLFQRRRYRKIYGFSICIIRVFGWLVVRPKRNNDNIDDDDDDEVMYSSFHLVYL